MDSCQMPQPGPCGRGSSLSLAPHCYPSPSLLSQQPLFRLFQLHFPLGFLLLSQGPFPPSCSTGGCPSPGSFLHPSPGPHSGLPEPSLSCFPCPCCCCSLGHFFLALSSSSLQLYGLTLHQPVRLCPTLHSLFRTCAHFISLSPSPGSQGTWSSPAPFLLGKGQMLLVFFLRELGSLGRKEWPARVRAHSVSREQIHLHLVVLTWFECEYGV